MCRLGVSVSRRNEAWEKPGELGSCDSLFGPPLPVFHLESETEN